VAGLLLAAPGTNGSKRTYSAAPLQQQEQQRPATPTPRPTPSEVPPSNDEEIVRVETNLTNVLFTAVDKQKRFITDLRQEDIRVTEDGTPQQIFTFTRQTDLPLSLAILVDTSASQERTLPDEKRAAREFVEQVLRPGKDEIAVVTFTGESTLEQGLTGSAARIRSAIERIDYVPPSGYVGGVGPVGTPPISGTNQGIAGSTAVWDSVWVTADEILTETPERTRRAIILISDGVDTSSRKKSDDAIERAVKADVVIYAVGIGDRYEFGLDEGKLRKVSERTGGRAFFPRGEAELRAAFEQIQQELRSQYLVSYSPTNKQKDNTYRQVRLELTNPELQKQNLRLVYRQGYFAQEAGSPATPRRRGK
jgi:VWFA-related protein